MFSWTIVMAHWPGTTSGTLSGHGAWQMQVARYDAAKAPGNGLDSLFVFARVEEASATASVNVDLARNIRLRPAC